MVYHVKDLEFRIERKCEEDSDQDLKVERKASKFQETEIENIQTNNDKLEFEIK
jgi:hypothetical protein